MHNFEGQISDEFSTDGATIQANSNGIGHHDTQSVVRILACSNDSGRSQMGVTVLKIIHSSSLSSSYDYFLTFSLPSKAMPPLDLLEEAKGVKVKDL